MCDRGQLFTKINNGNIANDVLLPNNLSFKVGLGLDMVRDSLTKLLDV